MPTKRTRKQRPAIPKITRRALTLFRKMQRLGPKCTCPDDPPHGDCAACTGWWTAHSELHAELNLWPWHWPAIFERGDPVTERWAEPQARIWHALKNAAQEARRKARQGKSELLTVRNSDLASP
jgi:hypothetical protein